MSDDWEILKESGNNKYKEKNYHAAISFYTDAIDINNKIDVLFSNRALCFTAIKKFKKAIYDLEKAIDLNPKSIKAYKRLFNLHLSLGNFGIAEGFGQKCVNLEPKEITHKTDMDSFHLTKKNWDEIHILVKNNNFIKAEELCVTCLERCSEYTDLKKVYIECLLQNNKPKEAIHFISSKLNEDEKNIDDFDYYSAKSLYFNSDYDNAKKYLLRAIKNGSDNHKYQKLMHNIREITKEKNKANEIFKANKYDEAIETYTKLLEFDPENKMFNSMIIANRALCHQKKKNLLEALTDINKSLQFNNKYTKAHIRRGNINMELGNYDDANFDFQTAKELDPYDNDINIKIKEAKSALKSNKKDHYKTLGVERHASADAIKKAYKLMAKKWHPDRNNKGTEEEKKQAEKKFKEINDANMILSDPQKKKVFDEGGDPDDISSGYDYGNGGMSFDQSDMFNIFFSQGGGGTRSSRTSSGHSSYGGDPYQFFFNR